ncbi:MAG: VWA domain-containing protein [Coriobacteriia bacterium]|nr:VWA domain-containing protein [Coriobacteriia bacterium]
MRLPRRAARLGILVTALCWALMLVGPTLSNAAPAGPATAPDRVPVLILDAGLGDAVYYRTHWLGEQSEVAASGGIRLLTSPQPGWWAGQGAPDTYVLTSSDDSGTPSGAVIDVKSIAWALDTLASRNTVGRVVLVAQGATGLQARTYLEDLGVVRQSDRADVVGLVLMGTPSSGLTLLRDYGDLDSWEPFVAGAGLTVSDVATGSPLLASLNSGRFPAVLKCLVVQGIGSSIAGYQSDGLVLPQDSVIPTSLAPSALDYVQVQARASQTLPLRDAWFKQTKAGGRLTGAVDQSEAERLAPMPGYVTDEQTRQLVRRFYETWFADAAPTTHISSRLVIDVSGSMREDLGRTKKITAAKRAARDFIGALEARQSVPDAVPEDLGIVSFNTQTRVVASPATSLDAADKRVAALGADGNTNVGKALQQGVNQFDGTPAVADKVLVFLSDGLSTAGMSEKAILSGPVADAKRAGIRIETIALGGVGDADVKFLKRIAQATGGSFHKADDLFGLRRDFLRARYSSLGSAGLDEEVKLAGKTPVELGTIQPGTRQLEIGLVPDEGSLSFEIQRGGRSVAATELAASTVKDGVATIAMHDPVPGKYTVVLTGEQGARKAQVFTVSQANAFKVETVGAPQDDTAMFLLVGVGAVGLVAVIVTIVASTRRRREQAEEPTENAGSQNEENGSQM